MSFFRQSSAFQEWNVAKNRSEDAFALFHEDVDHVHHALITTIREDFYDAKMKLYDVIIQTLVKYWDGGSQ